MEGRKEHEKSARERHRQNQDLKPTVPDWIKWCSAMTQDVNPTEIMSHVNDDTLQQWCDTWQSAMTKMLFVLDNIT